MQAILETYEAAGQNATTYDAIKDACAALLTMSRAELIALASKVSVYVGGMTRGRMTDAIRERLMGRLYMHHRTNYGSEGR